MKWKHLGIDVPVKLPWMSDSGNTPYLTAALLFLDGEDQTFLYVFIGDAPISVFPGQYKFPACLRLNIYLFFFLI